MKRCLTIFAVLILLVFVAQPAHALKAIVATIAASEVRVIGIQAEKKQPIHWEGTQVTTSDKFGLFHFSTTDLPIDCVGQLSDGVSTIEVVVFGCTTEQVVGGGVPQTGQTTSWLEGDDGDLQIGLPWPDPRFTDKFDGTVIDNLTGLIWTKSANLYGYTTFSDALTSCSSCGEGGYTDWRLPNVRELQSLIDYGQVQNNKPILPAGHPFTGPFGPGDQWYYWSSTSQGVSSAFCISFENGFMWSGSAGNVWCVRGGN